MDYFFRTVLQKVVSFMIITMELCMLGRSSSVQTNFPCLLLKPCEQSGLFQLANAITQITKN
jgi:hypothetical protein